MRERLLLKFCTHPHLQLSISFTHALSVRAPPNVVLQRSDKTGIDWLFLVGCIINHGLICYAGPSRAGGM